MGVGRPLGASQSSNGRSSSSIHTGAFVVGDHVNGCTPTCSHAGEWHHTSLLAVVQVEATGSTALVALSVNREWKGTANSSCVVGFTGLSFQREVHGK